MNMKLKLNLKPNLEPNLEPNLTLKLKLELSDFMLITFLIGSLMFCVPCQLAALGARDEAVVAEKTQTIKDSNGEVRVTWQWLARPGEMAVTIDYFGYLTQEGTVNLYLDLNGVKREFLTMQEELPNRIQRIRILSFHPSVNENGVNVLKTLPAADIVDYKLFKNAPYYPQFGKVRMELKFFANGRWDGDANRNNENYLFEFESAVSDRPTDHFSPNGV